MGKILIYAMQEGFGGVEKYVLNLSIYSANPSQKYGYIIIGNKTIYESELKKCNVDYFFVTHKNRSVLKNIIETNKLFKEQRKNYDKIYFNTSGLYYSVPYLLALKYRYIMVLHSHLTEVHNIKKIIHLFNRWWINKAFSKRLACSTPAAEWLFGKNANSATIVPNAIELEKFGFNERDREEYRNRLGISDCNTVFGNVGRLSVIKNQKFLLKIFKEIRDVNPDVKLLLVGDGEEQVSLQIAAEGDGISDDVIFYGKTNQPEKLMACMDCIVMPSLTEGFPITLVEAQASGLPCVVSDVITDEVNISGNISFKSLNDSAKEWASTICSSNLDRYDCMELLREQGYDVHNIDSFITELLHD